MKKLLNSLLLLLIVQAFATAQPKVATITPVMQKVMEQQQKTKFEKIELLELGQPFNEYRALQQVVSEATILNLDKAAVVDLYKRRPQAISLMLPAENGKTMQVDLVRYQIFSEDFKVSTSSSKKEVAYEQGAFYRGVIQGSQQSLAAISIFEDEVIGVLASAEDGNMVLGKIEKAEEYVFYQEKHMKVRNPHQGCQLPEIDLSAEELERLQTMATNNLSSKAAVGCVRIYFECEYNMYLEKGSVAATTNFMMGAYNGLATLYQNEDINTVVTEVKVWNTPDSYPTSSTPDALNSFSANVQNHGADLAHLVSRGAPTGGGVAWLDGLCNSYYAHAYSHINSTYQQLPTYSWTVGVLTHEMGHNLGSPHTQSCSWPGGAIDNCYTTEGNCSPGPSPVNGGTIMSYCHLTSTGINFNYGFGLYPGNLIRNTVATKPCLTACGNGPTCSDGIQNGEETGVDCGGSCPACPTEPTCSDGVQNGNETGVDCGGSCPACPTEPTCNDGIQNGDETGVDCGGSCSPCDTGGPCVETAVVIRTDYWGAETTWTITDGSGTTVASGGPYASYYNGATYYAYQCLPQACYTFTAYDSYGDGMCCESGNGGYWFYDYNQGAYIFSGGDFGASSSNQFCVGQGSMQPAPSFTVAPRLTEKKTSMTIYPNPTSDQLQANLSFGKAMTVDIQIVNLAGQVLSRQQAAVQEGMNQIPVDVNALSSGSYLLQIIGEEGRTVGKFNVFR